MTTAQLERETFRTSRLLDLFTESGLRAETGHEKKDWPLVVVKELLDNALDACEEAGNAPVIVVTVDEAGITVTDNGPGLPVETVRGIRDFNIRVSSREAYISPTRGAQGNALKTIIAMTFVLDGKRGQIEVEALGTRHLIDLTVDPVQGEPVAQHRDEPVSRTTGTSVRVIWPDSPFGQSWSTPKLDLYKLPTASPGSIRI